MPRIEDNALNAQDVADILHVSRNTVYGLVKAGELSSYLVGRKMRFTLADVDAYIARSHGAQLSAEGEEAASVNLGKGAFCIAGNDILADVVANYLGQEGVSLVRRYENSYAALHDVYMGAAHAALVHLFDRKTGRFNVSFVQRLVPGTPLVVFHLARRPAGLIVPRRNPKKLSKWSDLLREDVTVALCEHGSGSRVLIDENLVALGAPYTAFNKHVQCSSALAAAQFVAAGNADCAVGSEYLVSQFKGLSFIPLTIEEFALVVKKSEEHAAVLHTLRSYLSAPAFMAEASRLGSCDTAGAGNILYEV